MHRECASRLNAARHAAVLVGLVLLGGAGVLGLRSGILWPRSNHHTIAHEILTLEAKAGAVADVEFLDHVIDLVRGSIGAVHTEEMAEAIRVLTAIDSTLKGQGFRCRPATLLLSDALASQDLSLGEEKTPVDGNVPSMSLEQGGQGKGDRRIAGLPAHVRFADCDTLTFIYLGIGESLRLPLRAAAAPRHLFIRWHFKGRGYLNWDPTAGSLVTDDKFAAELHVAKAAIEKGVYFRSLSHCEVLSYAYANIGRRLAQSGRKAEATLAFDRAVAQHPWSPFAVYNRGVFRFDCGLNEQAEADFARAGELDPHHVKAFVLCGLICQRRGDLEGAVRDYTLALGAEPRHTIALLNRAAAWRALARYAEAIEDYTVVVESNAAPDVYANRAIVYADLKEYGKAKADLDVAVSLQPEDVHVLNTSAWFFATVPDCNIADPVRALRLVQKAVKKRTCEMTLDTLATSLARAGEFESACEVEMAAIELASDSTTREEFQKRLDLFKRRIEYVQE